MMQRCKTLAIVLGLALGSVLAGVAVATAQPTATVVLRSGERQTGQLISYNGSTYTFRIDGQTRTFGNNDVAAIEIGGSRQLTSDQQNQLAQGRPFVMLTNGVVVDGRVSQISGGSSVFNRQPSNVVVDTASGARTLNLGDVAAIYVTNFTGSTAGEAAIGTGGIIAMVNVPGNQQWTATNIQVKNGDILHFQSSGSIQFSPDPADKAGPGGAPNRHTVAGSPLPLSPGGSLLIRIGENGPVLPLSDQTAARMTADGMLYLGVNDDNVSDNVGNFAVTISK
jgi:hypothetical protein